MGRAHFLIGMVKKKIPHFLTEAIAFLNQENLGDTVVCNTYKHAKLFATTRNRNCDAAYVQHFMIYAFRLEDLAFAEKKEDGSQAPATCPVDKHTPLQSVFEFIMDISSLVESTYDPRVFSKFLQTTKLFRNKELKERLKDPRLDETYIDEVRKWSIKVCTTFNEGAVIERKETIGDGRCHYDFQKDTWKAVEEAKLKRTTKDTGRREPETRGKSTD